MAKRKARNQFGSLILDHKKSGINPTPVPAGGMEHAVGKLLMRATTLLETSSLSKV
jgi:hypothetical protein